MSKHVWELEADGSRSYRELGEAHGGPHCTVCDESFCQHEKDFDADAECPGPRVPCPSTDGEWTCIYDIGHDFEHYGMRTHSWNTST